MSDDQAQGDEGAGVSLREAAPVWARVAAQSFGGPAGQIAVMHRIILDEKKWISEERFLHALNFCMLLPGPEAQQLATYIGWLMHGWRGGLMAGGLFILPGFVCIMALSLLYSMLGHMAGVQGLFLGLKAAVIAIVAEALIRIAKRAFKGRVHYGIAAAAFIAIALLRVPFPFIILGASLFGAVFLKVKAGDGSLDEKRTPGLLRSAGVLAFGLTLWWGPIAAIYSVAGPESVFFKIGIFFSKASVVTFGGAYAVLAYVAQQAVGHYGWLTQAQMMDGLGMAETTPGPLIMVLQFVGFMGAAAHTEGLPPWLAGVAGACLTVWVTFVPCFLWIFLGAPYVERLRRVRALAAALEGVTAAVVGVILNLGLWFAFHALFARSREAAAGPLRVRLPELASLDHFLLVLTIIACWMQLKRKTGMGWTLGVCAAAGMVRALV